MALSTNGRNLAVTGVTGGVTHVSLHTADPGATGASEVTGGAPAYARKAVSWGAASGGSASISAGVTFDVPASTTITYVGLWNAAAAGTFEGSAQLSASETFGAQGTYNLTSLSVSVS